MQKDPSPESSEKIPLETLWSMVDPERTGSVDASLVQVVARHLAVSYSDQLTVHEDRKVTLQLSKPVTLHAGKKAEHTYETLTFRPAQGIDMLATDLKEGETAKTFAAAASMASVPEELFRHLSWWDCALLRGVVHLLMGKPPKTSALSTCSPTLPENLVFPEANFSTYPSKRSTSGTAKPFAASTNETFGNRPG